MTSFTPLIVDLHNKNVVIIGGGRVAERRLFTLVESGAKLTVISPTITEEIRIMWEKGVLKWVDKSFESDDISKAFFVVIATNDPVVNEAVIQSIPENTLVNDATNANRGNVQFPTTITRGRLSVSIATNGASPMLTKKIKKQLENHFSKNYGNYVDFLYECRQLLKNSVLSKEDQHMLLEQILADEYQNEQKQREFLSWIKTLQ